MKLKKVISGGQTGADRTGLECAKALGFETGGTAPKGWKTENGSDPSLAEFGLVESPSVFYEMRTRDNVKNSDITLWFGNTGSPGYYCTKSAAIKFKKEFIVNPTPDEFKEITTKFETINIAGNRSSTNPKVVQLVSDAFGVLNA